MVFYYLFIFLCVVFNNPLNSCEYANGNHKINHKGLQMMMLDVAFTAVFDGIVDCIL